MVSSLVLVMCCFLTFLSKVYSQTWVGTWSTGLLLVRHTPWTPPKPGLTNNTLRQLVRVSIGGPTVRVRFSNILSENTLTLRSVSIAVSKKGSAIDISTIKMLTFGGLESVTIAGKGDVYSDAAAFPLEKGSILAITICFGQTPLFITGHSEALTTTYVAAGCRVADAELKGAGVGVGRSWYVIERVEVTGPGIEHAAAIVAIGDSITDGAGSSSDKNRRWTDVLSARLLNNPATENISVLNVGIGGNCVLRGDEDETNGSRIMWKKGGRSPSALGRFDHDVLSQEGVKWVIVLEGVNDFGNIDRQRTHGGRGHRERERKKEEKEKAEKRKECAREEADKKACEAYEKKLKEKEENRRKEEEKNMALATAFAHSLTDAYTVMIDKAHARGIKIIGCTIVPFDGSFFDSPYKLAGARIANEWIRTKGRFDAVVDFYALMGRPDEPDTMVHEFHRGDYLHPNDAGYKKMGEAFDLGLFSL